VYGVAVAVETRTRQTIRSALARIAI